MDDAEQDRSDSTQSRRTRGKTWFAIFGGVVLVLVILVFFAYRSLESFMNPAPFVMEDSATPPSEAQMVASFFQLPESITHVYLFRDRSLFGSRVMRAQLSPEDFAKYQEWITSEAREVKAEQSLPDLPLRPAHIEQVREWWPEKMTASMQVFEYHTPFHHVILDETSSVVYVILSGD
jgi:hypothetical protein